MPVRSRSSGLLALGALAVDPLRHPPLGAEIGQQLGAPHSPRALVGRLAPARHDPFGAADGLRGLRHLAGGAAQRDVRLFAGDVGLGSGLGGSDGARAGLVLVGDGRLGGGDQPIAPPALLQHALGAAGGRLARARRSRRRANAPARVTARPVKESGSAASESTSQTPREQPLGERRHLRLGANLGEQPLRARQPGGIGGSGRRARRRRPAATSATPPCRRRASSSRSPAARSATSAAASRGPSAAESASS